MIRLPHRNHRYPSFGIIVCFILILSGCASRDDEQPLPFVAPEPPAKTENRPIASTWNDDFWDRPFPSFESGETPSAIASIQDTQSEPGGGLELFGSFTRHFQILAMGTLSYFLLILFLRISGKRTLSKMSAFDLVITVALGSTLSAAMIQKDLAISEAALALGLLVFLQYVVSALTVRSNLLSSVVKSQPRVLFFKGQFLDAAMKQERITRLEIIAAIRDQGLGGLDQAAAVLLETNGDLSALPTHGDANLASLLPHKFRTESGAPGRQSIASVPS